MQQNPSQTGEGRQRPWHPGEAPSREPWRDDCHHLQGGDHGRCQHYLEDSIISVVSLFSSDTRVPRYLDVLVKNLQMSASCLFCDHQRCVRLVDQLIKGVRGLQWRVLPWSLCPLWLQPPGELCHNIWTSCGNKKIGSLPPAQSFVGLYVFSGKPLVFLQIKIWQIANFPGKKDQNEGRTQEAEKEEPKKMQKIHKVLLEEYGMKFWRRRKIIQFGFLNRKIWQQHILDWYHSLHRLRLVNEDKMVAFRRKRVGSPTKTIPSTTQLL